MFSSDLPGSDRELGDTFVRVSLTLSMLSKRIPNGPLRDKILAIKNSMVCRTSGQVEPKSFNKSHFIDDLNFLDSNIESSIFSDLSKDIESDTSLDFRKFATSQTLKDGVELVGHFISKSAEEEQRTVFGIVLEPETVDSQTDIYSEEEITKTAWNFMESFQQIGLQHSKMLEQGRVSILESYVAPCDFDVGGQTVKKGSWLLRVRVNDEEIWSSVKSGNLTGFSIGGSAVRNMERHEANNE
jgi:hypothetical protein